MISRTSARLADLDACELALGDLDDGEHRIERNERRDRRAGEGKRGAADLGRHVGDDAVPRRAHDAAVALGLGRGERRFRRLVLRLEIDEVELRQRALVDQHAARLELGLALIIERLRLRDLRLARLVGEHGDDVALLARAGRA